MSINRHGEDMNIIVREIRCNKCKAAMGNVTGTDKERVNTESLKASGECVGGCVTKNLKIKRSKGSR